MHIAFPRTLGQASAKDSVTRALASGRFPHALLVHGEPGLGQHALLLDIAQLLSCESGEKRPCGACFPCRAFDASALETLHYLVPLSKADKKGADDDGEDAEGPESGQLDEIGDRIAAWHRAPYALGAPGKALVRMSQVRELIGRLRYAGTDGRARLVLVPWLESLGPEAANALLKTLEEPPPGVYFLIASDHRSGLMATLLSRCLHLGLSPLPTPEFRAVAEALCAAAGKSMAPRLLPFAEGSPGAYLELIEADGEELLEESLRFLVAARADWRVFADYAAAIPPGAEGLEHASRLLLFLLRAQRAHQVLRARHPDCFGGESEGHRGTAAALEREGWDTTLAPYLGPFEDLPDPRAFATFLEEAYRAVRAYSKPSIALTGLFLEYEAALADGVSA